MPALTVVGVSGIHFHDLRHTSNQFAADAGANIRELMDRMGHDSTRAAMIYLHSSTGRQGTIADQIAENAKTALTKSPGRIQRAATSKQQTQDNDRARRRGEK